MRVGDFIVGLLVLVLGLVGAVMAFGALDEGILIFGASLAGFAVVFIGGLVRRSRQRSHALGAGG